MINQPGQPKYCERQEVIAQIRDAAHRSRSVSIGGVARVYAATDQLQVPNMGHVDPSTRDAFTQQGLLLVEEVMPAVGMDIYIQTVAGNNGRVS